MVVHITCISYNWIRVYSLVICHTETYTSPPTLYLEVQEDRINYLSTGVLIFFIVLDYVLQLC